MQNLIMLNFIVTEMEPKYYQLYMWRAGLNKCSRENIHKNLSRALTCCCKRHANFSESPMAGRPLTSIWVCLGLGLEEKTLLIEKQCLIQTVINADRSS